MDNTAAAPKPMSGKKIPIPYPNHGPCIPGRDRDSQFLVGRWRANEVGKRSGLDGHSTAGKKTNTTTSMARYIHHRTHTLKRPVPAGLLYALCVVSVGVTGPQERPCDQTHSERDMVDNQWVSQSTHHTHATHTRHLWCAVLCPRVRMRWLRHAETDSPKVWHEKHTRIKAYHHEHHQYHTASGQATERERGRG